MMSSSGTANAVVIAIHDGFGNQMFQYGAGLALATHLDVPLRLDLRPSKHHRERPYTLKHLCITASEASEQELRALAPSPTRLSRVLRKLTRDALPRPTSRQFVETKFYHFDPRLFECVAPVWVNGFWQSVQYLQSVEAQLREQFQIRTAPTPAAQRLCERLGDAKTVCVHVRRGDYLGSSVFHNLALSYYEQAAALLTEELGDPTFVVFSDAPEWTEQHLKLPGEVVWSWSDERLPLIDDFRLMGQCRHAIIPNSTLSWWACFLNPAPDKRVYLPKRWFAPTEWGPPELYPPGWIAL